MILDDALQPSKTLQFALKAQEMKKQGRRILSLGLGEPDFDTPEHIKQAAVDALRAGCTRYGSAPGLPELRELVAAKLARENGIAAHPDEVLITPGAKNALFLACAAVLRPGDEVLNFTPCYVSNVPILKLAEPQATVHDVPLRSSDFRLDRDRILSLLGEHTRLILINTPNNPTGKMLDADDAEFLRGIVRRHSLYLLSDEVYERLVLADKPHVSPAACADIRERVLTVNGFSKAYSMTGWRIGYVHAGKPLAALMTKIHQQLNTNTAEFIQKAAIAALRGPQQHLDEFVARLRERAALYAAVLQRNPLLAGSRIEGGFFGFVDVRASGLCSDHLCARLLEERGVALTPGIAFGTDFDHWVRVSLAARTDALAEGLTHLSDFVTQARG